jgi:hypothetical protein
MQARPNATAEMLILGKFFEVAGAWKTFSSLDKSFSCGRFSCQGHFTRPRKYPALNRLHNRAQVEHVDPIRI